MLARFVGEKRIDYLRSLTWVPSNFARSASKLQSGGSLRINKVTLNDLPIRHSKSIGTR